MHLIWQLIMITDMLHASSAIGLLGALLHSFPFSSLHWARALLPLADQNGTILVRERAKAPGSIRNACVSFSPSVSIRLRMRTAVPLSFLQRGPRTAPA